MDAMGTMPTPPSSHKHKPIKASPTLTAIAMNTPKTKGLPRTANKSPTGVGEFEEHTHNAEEGEQSAEEHPSLLGEHEPELAAHNAEEGEQSAEEHPSLVCEYEPELAAHNAEEGEQSAEEHPSLLGEHEPELAAHNAEEGEQSAEEHPSLLGEHEPESTAHNSEEGDQNVEQSDAEHPSEDSRSEDFRHSRVMQYMAWMMSTLWLIAVIFIDHIQEESNSSIAWASYVSVNTMISVYVFWTIMLATSGHCPSSIEEDFIVCFSKKWKSFDKERIPSLLLRSFGKILLGELEPAEDRTGVKNHMNDVKAVHDPKNFDQFLEELPEEFRANHPRTLGVHQPESAAEQSAEEQTRLYPEKNHQ